MGQYVARTEISHLLSKLVFTYDLEASQGGRVGREEVAFIRTIGIEFRVKRSLKLTKLRH
jgi:hypothetical protein